MNLVDATVGNLNPRMIMAEDVFSIDGVLLIPEGMEIGISGINMLRNSIELKLPKNKEFRVFERAGATNPGVPGYKII